jgi:hypothetical protein
MVVPPHAQTNFEEAMDGNLPHSYGQDRLASAILTRQQEVTRRNRTQLCGGNARAARCKLIWRPSAGVNYRPRVGPARHLAVLIVLY